MTTDDLAALKRQLTANEARKPYLYDDATGKRITKGSTVIGHPTWGIGFNCDEIGFAETAIDAQFDETLQALIHDITQALPWTQDLPSGPFRAIVDVAYNAGFDGLLGFHQMLAYAQQGNYPAAALELINSRLEPHRAQRLAVLMRS